MKFCELYSILCEQGIVLDLEQIRIKMIKWQNKLQGIQKDRSEEGREYLKDKIKEYNAFINTNSDAIVTDPILNKLYTSFKKHFFLDF